MGNDRLREKLKAAGAVVGRQSAKIEARADSIIAREAKIEKMTDASFAPHESLLDEAEKGLQGLEASLRLLSNAPFESSSASGKPAGELKPAEPAQTPPGGAANQRPFPGENA